MANMAERHQSLMIFFIYLFEEFDQRTNSPEMESNVFSVEDSWHPTPRDKPPTTRPKSSRKRLKSGRKKRQEQESQQTYSAVGMYHLGK